MDICVFTPAIIYVLDRDKMSYILPCMPNWFLKRNIVFEIGYKASNRNIRIVKSIELMAFGYLGESYWCI